MSDSPASSFAKFVPGFDFLQSLARTTADAVPQMPNMANWVAPTLNPEELDKRITELKAVHFWLDQNSKALAATIQALEVQKMTLATLQGMNFSMADMANAFRLKAADTVASGFHKVSERAASTVHSVAEVAGKTEEVAKKVTDVAKPAAAAAVAGLVDPLQLWHSLTQQFQAIAAGAMAEAGKVTAVDMGKNLVKGAARTAVKNAEDASKRKAITASGTRVRGKNDAVDSEPAPAPRAGAATSRSAAKTPAKGGARRSPG